VTLNRLCASGLDAVGTAARAIRAGEIDLAIAGGVESMTRAPFVQGKSAEAFARTVEIFDTTIGWRFVNPLMKSQYGVDSMPETAENVAERYGITREQQVEGVIAFPQGTAGPGTLQYRPDEWSSYKLPWGVERVDIRADNELFIWVDSPGYSRPYVIARRTLPEPTSDTSAIFFEPDLLVEGVLAEVYKILASPKMSPGDERRYERLAREADTNWQAGLRSLGLLDPIERKQSNRIYVR